MARKTPRPGRTLAVFFLVIAIFYGLVAISGAWKPALGLDLKGGTRITLTANGNPSKANLDEAAGIIDQRVNASGFSEAETTTQGNRYIVVEIPGPTNNSLVDTVKRQAQLRFRTVACVGGTGAPVGPCSTATTPTLPSAAPSTFPSSEPSSTATGKPSGQSSSGSNNRAPFGRLEPAAKATTSPSSSPSPSGSESATVSPTDSSSSAPAGSSGTSDDPAQMALAFIKDPGADAIQAFNKFSCPAKKPVVDTPDKFLVTCGVGDEAGTKFLLSPTAVEGTDLTGAQATAPGQQQAQWTVDLTIGGDGKGVFAALSRAMYTTNDQFAIVLDGNVISHPGFNGVIPNGQAQISGSFNEASAKSLATSLKFGALPISFAKEGTSVETIGASLAGDQLSAGIWAGILGLLLVMIYCLLYYRGLGLVVITSLLVAGGITYALVLLLSKSAGFTLTLPGIAGLIVAVGITADSFIVYFERIRDEMRDGKSMRVAVQAGWKRARNTCLAADTVSLLAAAVLYIFAAGVVKGFAFALGLSTVIDLAVFFWFTHPMVTLLGSYKFFNRGHQLSGLSATTLGVDRINTVGGRA